MREQRYGKCMESTQIDRATKSWEALFVADLLLRCELSEMASRAWDMRSACCAPEPCSWKASEAVKERWCDGIKRWPSFFSNYTLHVLHGIASLQCASFCADSL